MDYIIKIIEALAWPVTIIVLAKMFQTQLTGLINRISRLKHGDTELSFQKQLQEIADKAELKHNPDSRQEHLIPDDEETTLVFKLLNVDPLSAILVAWERFSDAARKRLGDESPMNIGLNLIRKLNQQNLIDEPDLDILNFIRNVRNSAAHARDTYVDKETAQRICSILLQLANELEHPRGT
ncbi:MAG: hypothetical protein PF692_12340 [Kiritimatiellae bacterium]|jgi:hypothetical protein|nr:hypothetical protein [Kiritimatiellia bacterium]